MKKYNSYKEINLPWLKEVPSHWEVEKIRHVFEERKEKNINAKEKFILSVLKGIGVIPYSEKGNIGNKASENIENYKIVHKDDIVLNSMNMMVGSLGKSNYNGVLSQVYYVLKLIKSNQMDINYMEYVFKNSIFYESFRILGKGILDHRLRVPMDTFKNESLPLPPLQEQIQIANFLDWKINKIDKLIAKEKEKIRELNYLKKIVISDIFMSKKENTNKIASKYEWIGEIPEYYEVFPLKKLCYKIIDGTHQTPQYTSKGIPFLRVTDISKIEYGESINWDNVAFISKEEHKELYKRCNPEKNDVLVSKNGTIGIPKIVDWDEEVSIFVSLCLLKLNNLVIPEWIYYYFLTYLTEREISYGGKTGTITNLHLNKIREFKIPVPNLEKQKEIVKKINLSINEINNLFNKTNQQIQNLESLKQSLITEVVTGQIDVRDVVIPEYEKFTLEVSDDVEKEIEDNE
ncbi:restriction endonuclease subunit S [Ureaplasma diversum]|uniref:restriction endonuclease subunit S n=1 Tax=Ureaplasma diversum TaxID=42094 RepID=UPI000B0A60CE|nr:restriction endonuclease subunit S [Ureaplasma diversum]